MAIKALVTGGAGLIGSHIVDQLLQKGYDVRILDNLEPSVHLEGRPSWVPREAEFMQGDLRNIDDVEKALRGVELIFHQAVYGGFTPELTKMADVNMTGTARIFEVIRTRGLNIRKIVTASSQAVYGDGRYECAKCGPLAGGYRPIEQLERGDWEMRCPSCVQPACGIATSEDSPLRLSNMYSLSKHFEERLTLGLGREWGIPAVALRYGLTYGPRQSVYNPYSGICSIFSTRFLNGMAPVIYEDGRQTRDFTFVEDTARANVLVAEKDEANFQVFNVGTGQGTSVMTFATLLRDAYQAKVDPETPGAFRPIDMRHLVLDNSRLVALGWRPEVTVKEGIRRYAEWILSMPQPKEYFTQAEQALKHMRIVRQVGKENP